MLDQPSSGLPSTGRALVVAAVAVVLPLTATRAIDYIDVPMINAPDAPKAIAPVAAVAALSAQPAKEAAEHHHSNLSIDDGKVTSSGQTKEWKDLTPTERRRCGEVARRGAGGNRARQSWRHPARRSEGDGGGQSRSREEMHRGSWRRHGSKSTRRRGIDAHPAELRSAGQDASRSRHSPAS